VFNKIILNVWIENGPTVTYKIILNVWIENGPVL
jgi:hypothetical protein